MNSVMLLGLVFSDQLTEGLERWRLRTGAY